LKKNIRHYVLLGAGWFFIFLGILGIFLPVLQGILFLCIGLILLSGRSPRIRLLIMKTGRRYPKFRRALEGPRVKAKEWRQKISCKFRKD